MWPRPEAHGFTKFVLSTGAFLCVAAFVVPALLLRDTGVLLVSERTLDGLTPIARSEIRSRQQTSHHLGHAAPFIGIVLLAGGLGLLRYGFPRLRRQEEKDEEKTAMELDKLQGELKPQSEEEEQAELAATVDEDAGPTRPDPSAPKPHVKPYMRDARMQRARELEERVLQRIAEIAPPEYAMRPRVKVGGTPKLLVDGILVSTIDQLPDIVVEIKLGGPAVTMNIRNRLAEALLHLTSYRNRFARNAVAWLILILDEPLPASKREQLAMRASDLEGKVHLTLVEPEEIPSLTLPTG
jgi:hypothetical protein